MRARTFTAAMGALFVASSGAAAQVAPEPALVTAHLYGSNLVQAHFAVPEDQFILGGMLRFPLFDDFDLGARANVAFVDGADDYVSIGGDARYALVAQRLTGAGPTFNLTFHGGLGARSSGGLTRWKLPVGFPTGLTFGLARGSLEIFAHPRLEFGFQNGGGDESDIALLVDLGGLWQAGPVLGILVDIRFGDGIFDEGNQGVFGLGVSARF